MNNNETGIPIFPNEFVRFHDSKVFNFQLNRLYSWGGVSKEKVFNVAQKITDFESWINEMSIAAESALEQNQIMDAAEFFRSAEFFTSPKDIRKEALYDKYQSLIYEVIKKDTDCKKYYIPYKNIQLPAIQMKTKNKRKGKILIHGGYDSFMEELYRLGKYLNYKSYDVYLFEGPGQGYVLHKQETKMTHEWEQPTKAILDYFELEDVTMIGISLGGYLCLRAGAFEKRIKRLVAFDVIYDFFDTGAKKKGLIGYWITSWFFKNNKKDLFNRLTNNKMDEEVGQKDKTFSTRWSIQHGNYVMGTDNPYDLFSRFKKYSLKEISKEITQDVLLLAGEGDVIPISMYHQQKKALVNAKSVTGRIFKYTENAAQHCQLGNTKLVLDYIADWIEK